MNGTRVMRLGRGDGAATSDGSPLSARSKPYPQTACERCAQGVMDAENPHVWGECECDCHGRCDCCDGPLDDAYRADPDDGVRVCSRCTDAAHSPEVEVMAACIEQIESLTPEERERVMVWLADRVSSEIAKGCAAAWAIGELAR